jgi:Flp pilus assembly protein TadD
MPPADRIAALLDYFRRLAAAVNIDAAEASCRKLLEVSPDEAEAWAWRGLMASARANWTDAAVAHRQAIFLNPRNPSYCRYIAAAFRGHNKLTEA